LVRLIALLVTAATIALATAATASADTTVVGDWPFNEGVGTTVADLSGNGNTGTLSGGVQWVAGHSGTALEFDGQTGQVFVSDALSLEPVQLTVQAWVKLAGSPGDFKYIVAKGADGCQAGSYGLYSGPNGGLMFYVATTGGSYAQSPDAGSGVWDGGWHLATGTYDGSTVRLYVDGVQVGAGTAWNYPISYGLPNSNDLEFGNYPYSDCAGQDFHFSGGIDEPKIWDRALSPQEVQAQYNPCPQGTKVNVRWHYSANGSSGGWSGTQSATCPGSLTMGPQAMEGDLKVSPGTTLKTGYDLTVPGNNASFWITNTDTRVVFAVRCVSGASPAASTITVSMSPQAYSVTNSQWYPSGDQSNSLVYQGSIAVPDLCAGGQLRLNLGGTFTSSIS
jgi:Concanavalin A-like lectin/glucanases superfamily